MPDEIAEQWVDDAVFGDGERPERYWAIAELIVDGERPCGRTEILSGRLIRAWGWTPTEAAAKRDREKPFAFAQYQRTAGSPGLRHFEIRFR